MIETSARAIDVWVTKRTVYLKLADFRIISIPADKLGLQSEATDKQLQRVKLVTNGKILRWDELSKDIPVKGVIEGNLPPVDGNSEIIT